MEVGRERGRRKISTREIFFNNLAILYTLEIGSHDIL